MLRFPLKRTPRKFRGVLVGSGSGPSERIQFLKKLVTQLIRNERIEGRNDKMQETRAYAEQLINLAILHGDRHKPTMEMMDKWLLEKDLIHKMFKVLVPRYSQFPEACTSIYNLPAVYPGKGRFQAVLELKGNPYPPVIPHQRDTRYLLTNQLLSAAGREFYQERKGTELTSNKASVTSDTVEHLTNSVNNIDLRKDTKSSISKESVKVTQTKTSDEKQL